MREGNHAKGWLVAGVLGAAGVAAGVAALKHANINMRQVRNRAARMTSRAGREAGSFISHVGDSLADKIR